MAGLPHCGRQTEAIDPAWGRKALVSAVRSSAGTVQVPSLPWQLCRYADSAANAPTDATCHHGGLNTRRPQPEATGHRPKASCNCPSLGPGVVQCLTPQQHVLHVAGGWLRS